MIRNELNRALTQVKRNLFKARHQSSVLNIEKLEQENNEIDVEDEEQRLKDEAIEKKRDKSRLSPAHRNMLFNCKPYSDAAHWVHGTLKYNRKLYGKYGEASGVDPALCWPTKDEIKDKLEYERMAFPFTIPEMIESSKNARMERIKKTKERQEEIALKMTKLDDWVKQMKSRIATKEATAIAAKDRKDKLIEEVRRYFGFTVDPRDEKFKEMLEKKEKEQKKTMKEARKKAKEETLIKKLTNTKEEKSETKL